MDFSFCEIGFIAETCVYSRVVSPIEFPECLDIHMIEVVVREYHDIYLREMFPLYTRVSISLWPYPFYWARTFAPYRISENIHSSILYQDSRMSYIAHTYSVTVMSIWRCIWCDVSIFPERNLLIQYPLIKCEKSIFMLFTEKFFFCLCESKCLSRLPSDIIKSLSIEMIGNSSFIYTARIKNIYRICQCDEKYQREYD